jgi:hypothetical protein
VLDIKRQKLSYCKIESQQLKKWQRIPIRQMKNLHGEEKDSLFSGCCFLWLLPLS